MERQGWCVDVLGFEGRSAGSVNWNLIAIDKRRIRIHGKNKCLLPFSLLWWRFAEAYYWTLPSNRYIWDKVAEGPWDLVIANDYPVVPMAAAVAKVHGADYVVDCHEYAREQVSIQGLWKRGSLDIVQSRLCGRDQSSIPTYGARR